MSDMVERNVAERRAVVLRANGMERKKDGARLSMLIYNINEYVCNCQVFCIPPKARALLRRHVKIAVLLRSAN